MIITDLSLLQSTVRVGIKKVEFLDKRILFFLKD